MAFQYMLHNKVGLMRKRESFLRNSDNLHDVPQEDLLMVAGDMNCHIGFGVRNQEGENMLGLCQEHNLRVLNSYYRKRREQFITYKRGGNERHIDYVMCRRQEELRMKNCKVIPGEACLIKHRLLWAEVVIKGRKKRVWKIREKKVKVWKLKHPIKRKMVEERVSDRIEGANVDHAGFSNALLISARKGCGETTGRKKRGRET